MSPRAPKPIVNPSPIIPGTDHFSIWQDEDAAWIEFIPGYHYDFRQPSQLRPLCSPRIQNEQRPS